MRARMPWLALGEATILEVHADSRGSVREAYRASWFEGVPPIVQVVHSESQPYVMRAMHAHRLQYDIWHFVKGSAYVMLYDPATDTAEGTYHGPNSTVVIPPGIAHGFYTPDGCILTYYLTREYDGTDEYEFDAFDPAFPGVTLWPEMAKHATRSARDLAAKPFEEWLADAKSNAPSIATSIP